MAEQEHWDLEIKPQARWFELNLKEVWRYRDLLFLFVRRDFVAQYKQTVLGPLWHLIQPVFTTAIYVFIFSRLAQVPTDGIAPILFYLSGIVLWNYFSTSLTNTSSTFMTNAPIFGKVYFPRLVMPLSVMVSNLIRFGIQFLLLLGAMVYYHFNGYPIHISYTWLYLPPLLALLALIGLALGIIFSSLTTKYRDITVLLTFGIQLGMYATPIVYPMSYLKNSSFFFWMKLNPLSAIVEAFRYSLFGSGSFSVMDILYSTAFMILVLLAGLAIFNRVEKTFMDTV